MTPEQFVYWLQGFMEINDPVTIDSLQTQIIKDHLEMVFEKKTPDRKKDDFGGENPPFNPYAPNYPYQIGPLDPTWVSPYTITCTTTPGLERDQHQKLC